MSCRRKRINKLDAVIFRLRKAERFIMLGKMERASAEISDALIILRSLYKLINAGSSPKLRRRRQRRSP